MAKQGRFVVISEERETDMSARFRKPWQNTIIHALEALAVYSFYGLFRLLPLDAASSFGGGIGRTIGPYLGANKKALKNLRLVFPNKSEREHHALATGMWDNLGRNAGEAPHLHKIYNKGNRQRIEVVNESYLLEAYKKGKGVLITGGHLGNWEIGGLVCKSHDIPTSAIYRPPNNPHVDRLIKHMRKSTTFSLLPKGPDGARGIIRELRAKHAVGLLVDQKMNEGIEIPFFGIPAMTAPAVAHFSLRTHCVILPAQTIRTEGAHFKMVFHPPLEVDYQTSDPEQEVKRIMIKINAFLEEWITNHPEQWLWLHRRFPSTCYQNDK